MIQTFTKPETRFLSNFYPYKNKNGDTHPCPVTVIYRGLIFDCVENAYQAAKAANPADMIQFTKMTPFHSKKFVDDGGLKVRSDWDSIKLHVMTDLVRQKFTNNIGLKNMLLSTGRQRLIEGNDWGDVFWGVCEGKGRNNLGKILMKIRKDLKIEAKK